MNRRRFLREARTLAVASALSPLFLATGCATSGAPAPGRNASLQSGERLGATSVCFRDRFSATSDPKYPPQGPLLQLEMFPRYLAEEFGLHNVEPWSLHFAEDSLAYCERLRKAADAVQSQIINIQLDAPYDLASPDDAEREQSIAFVERWIDCAVACGSPMLRANSARTAPGRQPATTFDLATTAAAYRRVADYGERHGVRVLIENLVGFTVDIDNVVAIVAAVGSPWCRLVADWGNSPAATTSERIASLAKMFPTLALVSAKGIRFDSAFRSTDYDIGAIVRATEGAGFRGIYSIEVDDHTDPARAVHSMIREISAALQG